MTDRLHISADEVTDGRFDRFKLIGWWDQRRLADAKVLVIGAGALGNEIIKNLALLGVGRVVIADKDTIENSNLSRSVLYRADDTGQPKATIAALAAASLYPDIKAVGLNLDVVHDLGAGVFRWADVILGGLDNREARLAINRQAWRVGRPWVDGAIEVIQGVARVFTPDADQKNACYECTMSERDFKLLAHRRSCNLLTRAQMEGGRTPTTPTIGSIIAGVQVQEALKLLHGLPTLAGRGFVFAGDTAESYTVEYQRKPDCLRHDTLGEVVELDAGVSGMTAAALLGRARERLGLDAVLDLGRDVAQKIVCTNCRHERDVFRSLGSLTTADATCPACAQPAGEVVTFNTIRGDEPYADRTLADLGVPAFDIVTARTADAALGYELTGDAAAVLGDCHDEGLEWDVAAATVPPPGAPDDLDIAQVTPDGGPVRKLTRVNGDRGTGFAVVIQRTAVESIHTHGHSDTTVEVCGVLVGELCHDRVGPYLLISDHIAGDKAASRQTQVTFTADTWNTIQTAMETKHAGKKVVGWYHTHPGFGVFLSGMDLFIQDNFFNLAWQVAWVYDPLAETDGVFVWKAGKSVKAEFLIEENAGTSGHDFRAAFRKPAVRTLGQKVRGVAILTLVFVAACAVGWFAMQWLSDHGFRVRFPIER